MVAATTRRFGILPVLIPSGLLSTYFFFVLLSSPSFILGFFPFAVLKPLFGGLRLEREEAEELICISKQGREKSSGRKKKISDFLHLLQIPAAPLRKQYGEGGSGVREGRHFWQRGEKLRLLFRTIFHQMHLTLSLNHAEPKVGRRVFSSVGLEVEEILQKNRFLIPPPNGRVVVVGFSEG